MRARARAPAGTRPPAPSSSSPLTMSSRPLSTVYVSACSTAAMGDVQASRRSGGAPLRGELRRAACAPPARPPEATFLARLNVSTIFKEPRIRAFGATATRIGETSSARERHGRCRPAGEAETRTASSSVSLTAPARSGWMCPKTPSTRAGVKSRAADAGARSASPVVVHHPAASAPQCSNAARRAMGTSGRRAGAAGGGVEAHAAASRRSSAARARIARAPAAAVTRALPPTTLASACGRCMTAPSRATVAVR